MVFWKAWCGLRRDRRGVVALEYGLLTALIAVAIVVSLVEIGLNMNILFTNLSDVIGGSAAPGW